MRSTLVRYLVFGSCVWKVHEGLFVWRPDAAERCWSRTMRALSRELEFSGLYSNVRIPLNSVSLSLPKHLYSEDGQKFTEDPSLPLHMISCGYVGIQQTSTTVTSYAACNSHFNFQHATGLHTISACCPSGFSRRQNCQVFLQLSSRQFQPCTL